MSQAGHAAFAALVNFQDLAHQYRDECLTLFDKKGRLSPEARQRVGYGAVGYLLDCATFQREPKTPEQYVEDYWQKYHTRLTGGSR